MSSSKRIIFGLLAVMGVGVFASQSSAQTPIALTNGSFEEGVGGSATSGLTSAGTGVAGCPTGWTCADNGGSTTVFYGSSSANGTGPSNGLGAGLIVPDGNQAVYASASDGAVTITQNTAAMIATGASYTLDVYVEYGNCTLSCPSGAGSAPDAAIELLANGVPLLSEGAFAATSTLTEGVWQELSFTTAPGALDGAAGGTIGITLIDGGNSENALFFDDAQLFTAVTPEPGSFLLFGTGLLLIGGILRRKRALR